MAISRASMQQQLKGNRMKKKKMTVPKSINQSLTDYYKGQVKDVKNSFGLYLKGEPEAIAKKRTVRDNPKAINRLRRQKKKAQNKNVGGFLETFSPAYSIAKGKGPIGEAVRGGKGMGILGMLASQADKGKKKAGSDAMKATGMAGADRMSGGGEMVRSKRTRSIDGIATRGKTRGTQR